MLILRINDLLDFIILDWLLAIDGLGIGVYIPAIGKTDLSNNSNWSSSFTLIKWEVLNA